MKGKAGSKRSVPMTTVKSLAIRFYRLKSGHVPVGTYLKWFGHREDDKCCWWCRSKSLLAREHLFHLCSRWQDQKPELWKAVGKAMDGKRADSGTCKSLSFSPWKNAIKRCWTNWQRLTSGSSRQHSQRSPGRMRKGKVEGIWTGGGLSLVSSISLVSVCFHVIVSFSLIVCSWLIFHCYRG